MDTQVDNGLARVHAMLRVGVLGFLNYWPVRGVAPYEIGDVVSADGCTGNAWKTK